VRQLLSDPSAHSALKKNPHGTVIAGAIVDLSIQHQRPDMRAYRMRTYSGEEGECIEWYARKREATEAAPTAEDAAKGEHAEKHKGHEKHGKAHHEKKEGGEAGEAGEAK
jgi:hypothetical protein